jgi:hypothetical protein
MRLAALYMFLAFSPTCSHVTPVVKDCGEETVANLLNDVNTALATGDYVGQLGDMVTKFGICAVTKAVQEAVAALEGGRAQYDDLAATMAKRGQDWLNSHPAN